MKAKCKIEVTFLEFVYYGLCRIKRGKNITLWDLIDTSEKVLRKIEYINSMKGKNKTKKIIFTKDGLEIEKDWLYKF